MTEAHKLKTEEVSELLRRAIRNGIIQPGDDLVQEEIASRLGVSRIPLREALRGLTAVGIVQMEPGQGFRVTKLESEEITELYNLRLQIEPLFAEAIITHISKPQVSVLADLDKKMRAQNDNAEEWANANYDFHLGMYKSAGGNHTLRIVRQLLDLVEPYSRMYVYELQNVDRVQNEHSSMIEAIQSNDVEGLNEAISLHLIGARDGLVTAMAAETDIDPKNLGII